MISMLLLFFIGLILTLVVMGLTWRYAVKTENSGVVDIVWTLSVGALAVFYALFLDTGWGGRHALVGAVVVLWSLRLGLHILRRYRHEPEDARYASIKREWGNQANRKLLHFYLIQGVAASFLSIAFIAAMSRSEMALTLWDLIGLLIALGSVIGEGIADAQLARYKQSPHAKGKTCRVGLWAYSRHPNYFFEWTFWLAFPVIAIGTHAFWVAALSPLVLYYFITQKTGIPATEAQALKSRGEDYRRYQQEVNAFFPGWRRRYHRAGKMKNNKKISS